MERANFGSKSATTSLPEVRVKLGSSLTRIYTSNSCPFPSHTPSRVKLGNSLTHTHTPVFGKNQPGQKLMISIHIPFMEIAFSGPGPGGPNPTGLYALYKNIGKPMTISGHRWTSLGNMSTQKNAMKPRTQNIENQQERAKKQWKPILNQRKTPCRSSKFKEMHRKSHLPHDKST